MNKKRGQTTIFIIIGIAIVAIGVLIYAFYPQIESTLGLKEQNPSEFIDSCLKDDLTRNVDLLSLQGGSVRPEHYILYNGDKIDYLCYTNEYYRTCVVQQPMLIEHVEKEIKDNIEGKVRECFQELKTSYEESDYVVNMKTGETKIELLPKRIVASFSYSLSLSKGEEASNYEKFSVVINNNLYELLSIAVSIVESEALYGDSETTLYMAYYEDLKVEKKNQVEGSTIYILTDRNTGNKFQFASRSVVWPPGYGV